MKPKNTLLIMILLAVMLMGVACNAAQDADDEVIGMANPASVYCEEQGGTLEIRTQKDGSQYGVCIFDDGSECDEWAFYQEHCKPGDIFPAADIEEPAPVEEVTKSILVTSLYGSVISPSSKGPSDSLLVLTSEGFSPIFITGENGEISAMIEELKDKNEPVNKANFWGRLDIPPQGEPLFTVSLIKLDGPGEEMQGDKIEGWEGVVYSGPSGQRSGGDDYFALLGEMPIQYGIDTRDDALRLQLEALRDTGQAVRIWGELHAGRPDWNGTQIVVTLIEPIEADASLIPPAPSW